MPGSKASTFEGRAILNSSLRHLLRARCRLGCFARSFCHQRFDRASEHGTAFGELFPLPLPYPEVLCKGATDEDGRLALKRGVSAVIIILNYLHLGRPRCCAKELRMRRPLSKKQWSGVKRLEFLMKAWIEVSPIDAEGMGRTAAKVESIEETLKKLEVAAATHVSQQCNYFRGGDRRGVDCLGEKSRGVKIGWMPDEAGFTTFKKVEADRLTFVGTPSFDPTPYLDKRSQAIFNDPIQCRDDPASYRGPVPKLKVHCPPDEKLKLYELLDASNRLGVHRRGEVSLKFGSGLFAVTKDLSRDRLILDSRGANLLEKPAQRWIRSLACGESLVKLVLKKGEVLRASGNDLRDFYYLFRCSESRSRRNFLVGEVPARKLQHLHSVREKGFATGMLVGSLRTLAMGDTQAVELAQTCHLSLALNGGVVSRSSLISMHQPLPRGTQLTGLVIDDYISMSIDSEKDCEKPSRGGEKADLMTEEYKRVGLIPNEKKAFRDEEDSTFWGADLRGRDGLVRGSLKRAIPLAGIILKIVQARTATCLLLETIAGSLISLFLYRRRLLSLMDSVFASYRGREDREIVKLDGRTLSDLLCMSCLLPLAVTNLRAKVSPRLTATDASSWGEAGVVASVPERIIEEIYRHTLKKSVWVRLLSPARALQRQKNLLQPEDEIPNPEDRFHSHPLWQSLAEGLDFRVLFSKSKTSSRHINVGELRAMLRSEHLHALGEPESREVYALDSQVALGCLLKGRSSSSALNEELVGSLPVMLLQDKYSEGIYFETSVNPGDDPTRGKEVRKPTKSLPWWWEELKNGCYAGFDDWMRRHDVHPDETCGLPEFAELLHGKLLEEETQREESGLFEERFRREEELQCFTDVFQRGGTEEQTISAEEDEPKKLISSVLADHDTEAETATSRGDDVSPCSLEDVREDEDKSFEETEVTEAEITEGGEKAEEKEKEPEARSPKKPKGELSARGVQLLRKIPESQFVGLKDPTFSDLRAGFLDLFSGERGVAEAIHRISGRWVLCYDLAHSAREDLDDSTIKEEVEELLREGCFHGAGGGPVCGSFSMAVTPPVRSREHPYGLPTASENMKPKIALGNRFARWMIKILEIGLGMGLCVWLENPASSWLFRLPIWKAFMRRHPEVGGWLLDYCRFHAKWRKRTLIVTNSLLKNFRTLCTGGHTHQLLRGRCKEKRKSWTAVAQAYPRGVALAIAAGVLLHCGFAEWKGCFDPSACARAGHKRIGEAKNPGPRSVAQRQRGDLSQVKLVEAKTLAIQDKAWAGFLGWASELISPGAVRTAMAQPALLAELLREYGYHLYSNGKSLFVYRHLIVLVQQQIVGAKAYLGICWETINRWEIQEPVEHRVPLPFQIFLGMIGVGLCWNWRSFVAVLGISFYGISRPGEALAATRGDLILPSDRLEFDSSVAYVRVGAAKARRRGKHVVQHLTINDGTFVKFLEKYYGSWPPTAKLFQGSHSAFRRRWDAVLAALHIDKKVSLTPGGIRGGGCVFSFQSGVSIPMLMWKMRLKHQVTLESYLQEVVATTVLPRLSANSRRRISAAAMIAPRLLNL